MTVVQRGTWPGWDGGVVLELADDAAAALLTAARAYQADKRVDLKGDLAVLPVGCKRTAAQVAEMQLAFDHRDVALLRKYNMDTASRARPSSTSPHLSGYCVDISNNGFLAWLVVNGARYGLKRTLVAANDLRHFQYFPGTATAALDVRTLDNDVPTTPEDDTMRLLYFPGDTGHAPAYMLVTEGRVFDVPGTEITGDLADLSQALQVDASKLHNVTASQRAALIKYLNAPTGAAAPVAPYTLAQIATATADELARRAQS